MFTVSFFSRRQWLPPVLAGRLRRPADASSAAVVLREETVNKLKAVQSIRVQYLTVKIAQQYNIYKNTTVQK
jgi:hypothetical protein